MVLITESFNSIDQEHFGLQNFTSPPTERGAKIGAKGGNGGGGGFFNFKEGLSGQKGVGRMIRGGRQHFFLFLPRIKTEKQSINLIFKLSNHYFTLNKYFSCDV